MDKTTHVDLTVLSIFQKTVTFDHNLTLLHNFIAFYFTTFFAGIYILNEKVRNVNLKLNYRRKHV